jgi:hypothetical protein
MKMQHDTGPMPPNAIAKETVDAVRRALQHEIARGLSTEHAPELHAALSALALEARLKAVPPEQLLITLKSTWLAIPEIENTRDHAEKTRLLQRIVTISIKAYFGG